MYLCIYLYISIYVYLHNTCITCNTLMYYVLIVHVCIGYAYRDIETCINKYIYLFFVNIFISYSF